MFFNSIKNIKSLSVLNPKSIRIFKIFGEDNYKLKKILKYNYFRGIKNDPLKILLILYYYHI
jgi:hypothetical protein